MSTWNLRVLETTDEDDDREYRIIECYYDDQNNLIAWSEAHPPRGNSIHELVGEVQRLYFVVAEAFARLKSDAESAFWGPLRADDLPPDAEVDSNSPDTAEWWSNMLDGESTPIPARPTK